MPVEIPLPSIAMAFFAVKNLCTTESHPCIPWEFKIETEIPAQIRGNKEDRQAWYNNPATSHQFYTGLEPLNPNLRVNKEGNPPRTLHGFVADYDLPIPDERIDEGLKSMPIKPSWVERSLGGNVRLVWILTEPMRLDSFPFAIIVLEKAVDWLALGMLPGLDEPAFKNPTRLYCNGGVWRATGAGPIPISKSQSFLVKAAKVFRWPVKEDAVIPLDVVESKLKEKYPGMDWPDDFSIDSQGPSFWIPESTSPMSAIVKTGGMYSFSAHAPQPFTPWSDEALLGKNFCAGFQEVAMTKATADKWFDSKTYWRKICEEYHPNERTEFMLHLRVECRLSGKSGPSGSSQIEEALSHIHNHNRVKAAAPFVFQRPGLVRFNGDAMLNIYNCTPIQPAEGKQVWGPTGNFSFLSRHFDTFFVTPEQLAHFLAWFKHYYLCAVNFAPHPGQHIFLMGGVNIGKTFTNRFIIGQAVGGFIDASDFLIENTDFNSHLFKRPHWVVDDETPANSNGALLRTASILKKLAANQQFLVNEKFRVAGQVAWMGRVGITANLDFISSRMLTGLDNNSLDKISLYKCASERDFKFPSRSETERLGMKELPYFLRWLLDHTSPDWILPDSRYGIPSYHDKSLLDQGHQTSPTAGFKECLIKALSLYFTEESGAPNYSGTVSDIVTLMRGSSGELLRALKLEQANRYLEHIQREGLLKLKTYAGEFNVRIWQFENFVPPKTPTIPPPPVANPNEPNPFQK